MVEMRWIIRKPKSTRLPPIKVLQYRYPEDQIKTLESGQIARFQGWSEWIDVPTVSEP